MKIQNIAHVRIQWIFFALALLVAVVGVLSQSQQVGAAGNRLGTPQVTLNPGGGILANGTDGLRFTINADQNYSGGASYNSAIEGQDGVVYRGTYQYCCSAGGPMINIGGTLFGQSGPAGSAEDWQSIQIVATSGAASTGVRTANTGNSSATIRYTVIHEGRTYTIDRTVSYLYPNDFVTDDYSFVIPAGNTHQVKFYLGGDTAPGSSDQGYGIMLTQPVRSVISLNTSSNIMFGFREIVGSRAFDGATSQSYYTPYSTVSNGNNIGFVGTASNHDAGLMMQWNLGTTPGTYTGKFEQFATKQGTNLNAVFAQPRADVDEDVNLNISIVNSELHTESGLGYTLTLPSGVMIEGAPTSNCGGTLTTDTESTPHSISLSGASVAGAANCVISVPVSSSAPGSYAITSANASGLQGALTNNIGVSRLNVAVYTLSYATGGGTSIADAAYEQGQIATVASTSRPGYIFNGWNTQANGQGTSYAVDDDLTIGSSDITLYAQWEAIPYNLTFDAQGGGAVSAHNNIAAGTDIELTDTVRAGYTFLGWDTAANGTGTRYTNGNVFTMPTSNVTLYAIWVQRITVSYNTQGGSSASASSGNLGSSVNLRNAPTRSGYTFVGWNTAADGSGQSRNAGSSYVLPSSDITLYAIWEDSDGITLVTENAAPNAGDANDDGVLDSQQASVSSFESTVTGKPVSLAITSDDECFIGSAAVKASSDLGTDAAYTYPLGLLDFTVECGNDGFTATIKQYFYDAPTADFVLRKYINSQYIPIDGATMERQTIAGRQVLVVAYNVTDGGPLDADGEVNGVIVDPAGPARSVVVPGAPNTGFARQIATSLPLVPVIGAVIVVIAVIVAYVSRARHLKM